MNNENENKKLVFTTKSGLKSTIDGIDRLHDEDSWAMTVQVNCTDVLTGNHWSLTFSDAFANFSEDDFAEMLDA